MSSWKLCKINPELWIWHGISSVIVYPFFHVGNGHCCCWHPLAIPWCPGSQPIRSCVSDFSANQSSHPTSSSTLLFPPSLTLHAWVENTAHSLTSHVLWCDYCACTHHSVDAENLYCASLIFFQQIECFSIICLRTTYKPEHVTNVSPVFPHFVFSFLLPLKKEIDCHKHWRILIVKMILGFQLFMFGLSVFPRFRSIAVTLLLLN